MRDGGLPGYLKDKRRELGGITQADLAELMGEDVETNYVTQLETGRIKIPQQPYLGKLADALGVSEIEILRATGLVRESPKSAGSDERDPLLNVVMSGARRLTPRGREMLADYVRSLQKWEGKADGDKDRQ